MGGYYRVPADNRDLNYAQYFSEGEEKLSHLDDYTSHNTDCGWTSSKSRICC